MTTPPGPPTPSGEPTFMSEDEYDNEYLPQPNPEDGSDFWEFEATKRYPIEHVWSIVEVDGDLYGLPGYHIVNKIGYNITLKPWSHDNIEVKMWNPHDDHDSDCKEGDEPCNIV